MNYRSGQATGNEGFYWLGRIREHAPTTAVILLTAYGDVRTAVRALKAGATDFLLKPWHNEQLLQMPPAARGAACVEGSLVERPAVAGKAHQCEGWPLPG